MTIKLNEQIAFLRKQKDITQEELAKVLGITNQSVSKWESGNNYPDVQLLPEIANYFEVSVDELLGYKPSGTFGDVCLKIKALLEGTEKNSRPEMAYKLSYLTVQGAVLPEKYQANLSWETGVEDDADIDFFKGGHSILTSSEVDTYVKKNAVFIASKQRYKPFTPREIRDIHLAVKPLGDKNVLKVLFGLYELTVHDNDIFMPLEMIAEKCNLPLKEAEVALDQLPVQIGIDGVGYRLDGGWHIPPLLMMLTSGEFRD